jgi:hypothetical protein
MKNFYDKYSFEIKAIILTILAAVTLIAVYVQFNYSTNSKAQKIIAGLEQSEKERSKRLPIGKKEPVQMIDMKDVMEKHLSPAALAEVKRIEAERNQPKVVVVAQ